MANDINLTNAVLGDMATTPWRASRAARTGWLYGYDGDDLLLGDSDADVLAGGPACQRTGSNSTATTAVT
jgi:hypothetical protein